MTIGEAKSLPLNVLLAHLTNLNEDFDCPCNCMVESWMCACDKMMASGKELEKLQNLADQEKDQCDKFERCPQRIAFERILEKLK